MMEVRGRLTPEQGALLMRAIEAASGRTGATGMGTTERAELAKAGSSLFPMGIRCRGPDAPGRRGRTLVGVHSPPPGRHGTVHRRGMGVIGVPR